MIDTKTQYDVEIGVDVSKASLDVSAGGKVERLPNTKAGAIQLLRKFRPKAATFRVSCEATGTYSHTLIKACLHANVPVSQLNPLQVKHYIRSSGRLAKTDAIDAEKIRQFAFHHQPPRIKNNWLELDRLRQYQRRMEALIKVRSAAKASIDKYDEATILKELKTEINRLTRKIDDYTKKLETLLKLHPELVAKRKLMETVKGIGPVTSLSLILHMPELGELNRREVATLAGLAPIHRESGKKHGKRKIGGGRKSPRTALYMAALSASKYNDQLTGFYQQLRSRGKLAKVALTAVARKLVIYLNTLLKPHHPSEQPNSTTLNPSPT